MNKLNDDIETRQKVAIYIRVSTAYQIDKDSLPMQRKDLIAYSELILGISDYVIFEDAGYSGKNTDRPAYQEMMRRISHHEFSHLLVWKIDRISRNLIDFSEMYSELKKLRVVFVSKNEKFDTSTAMGEAMLKIILVFAELERNMTAERVTATMISRASKGQWNGGRIPYGYNYNSQSGEFTIRDDEAEICRMIADDYLKHKSLVHTTRMLNERGYKTRSGVDWSPTAVWIIAQSPFYVGTYQYNKHKGTDRKIKNDPDEWVTVENHHPPIFTKEQHAKILSVLEENKRVQNTSDQHNNTKNVYVFGQICYCGKCGSKMSSSTGRILSDGYRTSVYSCPKRRKTKNCDNPSLNDLIIGEFVINYVSNILNAKKSFSMIESPEDLQKMLLRGQCFKSIDRIDEHGLNELFDLLARYKNDNTFLLTAKSRRKPFSIDDDTKTLRKDKERQERALKRLQNLFLYDDHPMSEREYITRREEIISKLTEINQKLGLKRNAVDDVLTDQEFIKKASHLLINSRLTDRAYIYYKNLASSVSPDVLREYVHSIIDNLQIKNGRVAAITFKNGITHHFAYKKD